MNSSARLFTSALLLLLLPSLIDANNPFAVAFGKVAAAANAMTPTGMSAGMEARSLVDCRDTFLLGLDDLFIAFEKCAEDLEVATKPYCLHKCAYKALHLFDASGQPNEANLNEIAEKVYKTKTEAARKSQEDFVNDFFHCYYSGTPDFVGTKGSKCFGVRKFVRCLQDRNSDSCTRRNVVQEFKPHNQKAEDEEDDE